ncbi:MAG: hypothetical protein AAF432_13490 [Planctomycetota bacterium]
MAVRWVEGAVYHSVCLLASALTLVGCGSEQIVNPSFPITTDDARSEMRLMQDNRVQFERPVVVLGGIHDPGVAAPHIARVIRRTGTEDSRVISISFLTTWTFDQCRNRVIKVLDREFGENGEPFTGEVDVVGMSMGGLVGRYSAIPRDDGRRIRIRRMCTISSPHRGAKLAWLGFFDPRAHDMKPGSPFMVALDDALLNDPYEIVPYVRLTDWIVGEQYASPHNQTVYWLSTPFLEGAHVAAHRDPRILGDICRRLRGETPFTVDPPTPLPSDEQPTNKDAAMPPADSLAQSSTTDS